MGETIKVTNAALDGLVSALNSLDGIKLTGGIQEAFEFADDVQWNLSKNAVICERAKDFHKRGLSDAMKKHKIVQGEQLTEENRDRMVALQAEVDGLDTREVELTGILFVTLAELRTKPPAGDRKAGKNLIPISVLKRLNPIIREIPAA